MLLVPKAQGLLEVLQTIYETEPSISADGGPGREPSLEILPRTPLHSIPVAGERPHVCLTLGPGPGPASTPHLPQVGPILIALGGCTKHREVGAIPPPAECLSGDGVPLPRLPSHLL